MVAANDSQKKVKVDEPDVLSINGEDVHVDSAGRVIKVVKKDKAKKFKAATKNLESQIEASNSDKEIEMAEIMRRQYER